MSAPAKVVAFQALSPHQGQRSQANTKAKYTPGYDPAPATPPPHFSAIQRKHHKIICDRLEQVGLNSSTFSLHIDAAARLMAMVEELDVVIQQEGLTIDNTNERTGIQTSVLNPKVKLRDGYLKQAMQTVERLGLTPAEIARIGLRRSQNPRGPASVGTDWDELR